MQLFGKGKSSSTKTILVLDAGSSSVGACLTTLDKQGPPTLLKQTRIETPIDADRNIQKLTERMVNAARQAIVAVVAETTAPPPALKAPEGAPAGSAPVAPEVKPLIKSADAQKISHIAVFLPAPWSTLQLHTLELTQKEPIKVTAGVLENMIAQYAEKEGALPTGAELIERSALGIHLNGYMVNDIPKNAAANAISLTVVSVQAHQSLLSSLRDVLRDLIGHTPTISFHSTNLSLAWGLSAVFPDEDSYLLCNGEGEVTELLLVDEHVAKASATAPQGCAAVLRTLNVHADMARAEAATALTLAKEKESPMQDKLAQTLAAAQKTCADSFETAAKDLFTHFGAPAKIYTLATGPEASWFADALSQAPFLKNSVPGGVPVTGVPYGAVGKYLNIGGFAPAPSGAPGGRGSDMFLALEAIFCDSRFDEDRTFNFSLK